MRKADVDMDALTAFVQKIIGPASIERTPDGSSTQVYRVVPGEEVFYLRVAEEADASLAPEVEIHQILHRAGVRIPEVVHFEPFLAALDRSVMITRQIPGTPVTSDTDDADTAAICRAAGRDLALINSVEVRGFDWIVRDGHPRPLRAERSTYADFVFSDRAVDCLTRLGFTAVQRDGVEAMLDEERRCGPSGPVGLLAHGDLDLGHVFALEGSYTGIIDFGEIRGAARWYDLGEFALHSDDPQSALALQHLQEGYAQVCPLPDDFAVRIRNTSAMVATHRLAKWLRRDGGAAWDSWFFRWNRTRLLDLLGARP